MAEASWPRQLAQGLDALAMSLDGRAQGRLLDYLHLLYKWNRAFNLTAVRDPGQAVSRQLLDSLAILPWVEGERIIDLGSGAGLPGIPLAIAQPDRAFTLLDSNGKKSRFLNQVRLELGLENLEVVRARVEEYRPERGFDTLVSRAFAPLPKLVAWSEHLRNPGGCWLAMKGRYPTEELKALPPTLAVQVHPLKVPGDPAQRHLVHLGCRKPADSTENN